LKNIAGVSNSNFTFWKNASLQQLKTRTGSFKLTSDLQMQNQEDVLYTADIWVGNPPQKLRALFDTGSQHTWILSKKSQINKDAKSRFHNYYDESLSSTARTLTNKKGKCKFGTGELKGHFITDDFRVGLLDETHKVNGLVQVNNHSRLQWE
jgi:pepsin A